VQSRLAAQVGRDDAPAGGGEVRGERPRGLDRHGAHAGGGPEVPAAVAPERQHDDRDAEHRPGEVDQAVQGGIGRAGRGSERGVRGRVGHREARRHPGASS
jgi:hypothetical protein